MSSCTQSSPPPVAAPEKSGAAGGCAVCQAHPAEGHLLLALPLWSGLTVPASLCVPLCPAHAEALETGYLLPDQVTEHCGGALLLPPHLEEGRYDYWGNPVLANGTRLRGELFFTEAAQRLLAPHADSHGVLPWTKYPRTLHMPFSPGVGSDDKVLDNLSHFEGHEVVVTVKMDGENSTLYRDHCHARSLDSRHHVSRDWLKRLWGQIRFEIPENWRLCGENLYAQHSLAYADLPSYFMLFSVWDDRNYALSWDDTLLWAELLGLTPVPVVYRGRFDEKAIRQLAAELDTTRHEGLVLRKAQGFALGEFRQSVAKWVRKGHVETDDHWMHGPLVRNGLQLGSGS